MYSLGVLLVQALAVAIDAALLTSAIKHGRDRIARAVVRDRRVAIDDRREAAPERRNSPRYHTNALTKLLLNLWAFAKHRRH